MNETPLERAEAIDMMRVLEHGGKVKMVMIDNRTMAIDTPQDHEKVIEMLKGDSLMTRYINL